MGKTPVWPDEGAGASLRLSLARLSLILVDPAEIWAVGAGVAAR